MKMQHWQWKKKKNLLELTCLYGGLEVQGTPNFNKFHIKTNFLFKIFLCYTHTEHIRIKQTKTLWKPAFL